MRKLEGKPVADKIKESVVSAARTLRANQITPTLAVVVATDDPDTAWYVRSIQKAAASCEIDVQLKDLGPSVTTEAIAVEISNLASDPMVHGILLQTPLPEGVDHDRLIGLIPASKDVDGVSPESIGRIANGIPGFAPATAEAVLEVLHSYTVPIEGSHAVVVGRSRIVGKPVSLMLLNENATVTVCHSKTADLTSVTTQADILVAAAGHAGLITSQHIREGAVVIDVGTNSTPDGSLVGDVDPQVSEKADITPVPGGVGPVTSALILQHTVTAAQQQTVSK